MSKLTPWISCKTNPVHEGIYQINDGSGEPYAWRRWLGPLGWGFYMLAYEKDSDLDSFLPTNITTTGEKWRGLAKKPKCAS